jgi:hypothetical protein
MRIAVIITGQMRDYKANITNHIKHIIEPNNADVFVYACNKDTVHTLGKNITQKYNLTSVNDPNHMMQEIKSGYEHNLRDVIIDENEDLDSSNFGTLGYFKRKMNNQMRNIQNGYNMAINYSRKNNFEYDAIVRCRPDNSMFPQKVDIERMSIEEGVVYSTIFPSGHKDPWFFSFAKPKTFEKYCSYIYMKGEDETRTDSGFNSPEADLERYLCDNKLEIVWIKNICRPFYGYDKTKPIVDFQYRNKNEKLLDPKGQWVQQIE